MRIFNVVIPNHTTLTNYKIWDYALKIKIPHFKNVCMLDELPASVKDNECGILNLNKSGEKGSHWVAYWKRGNTKIYFDSYRQITPIEIQKYLKAIEEFFVEPKT